MASGPITSQEIDGETVETVADFILGGSKITADGYCSHEIKRRILLGRKVMTNIDSILKSRDITLPTKVRLVKAMVFPVVMYGYESWTIKKAEHQRIDAFELWSWRRLLRVPWTSRRSNQSILKASPTQWTWVWVDSSSWWWIGRLGMLRFHGVAKSQTRLSDWTELTDIPTMEYNLWKKPDKLSSVAQSCPTLCNPRDCSMPGFPVLHKHLELAQTHVHRFGDAIQPTHPLSSPSPPAFNLSQCQGLFQWVSSLHQVAKVLKLRCQHQSFQWIFRTDFL